MAQVSQTGGSNLKRIIERARTAQGVNETDVGFFPTDREPDGQPVAMTALRNEFGTERIPERPFMRSAGRASLDDVVELIRDRIDGETLVVDESLAHDIGDTVAEHIRRRIETKRRPENAPTTRERKGKDDPLVDSQKLRRSVRVRVR